MQAKNLKTLFLDQYKGLEKVGPFRKRAEEAGNKEVGLINTLANRWRRVPDSEGKRLVSKILSFYDAKAPLLDAVLKDNPVLFEQLYQESSKEYSQLYWLEVACALGRETLMNYFINTSELDVKSSSNLLAYGLSTGNALFAYRLAILLKEKKATHQECLSLYNKCSLSDLENVKSLMEVKETKEVDASQKMNMS